MQGNLEVSLLKKGSGATPESVRAATATMLEELGPQRLIANLGEGLLGVEDPALVAAFIDACHSESERLIRSARV